MFLNIFFDPHLLQKIGIVKLGDVHTLSINARKSDVSLQVREIAVPLANHLEGDVAVRLFADGVDAAEQDKVQVSVDQDVYPLADYEFDDVPDKLHQLLFELE